MSALEQIYTLLKSKVSCKQVRIPRLWNTLGFDAQDVSNHEQLVNPAAFMIASIDYIRTHKQTINHKPIVEHTVYSMMVRTLTAWDHEQKDCIQPGTFLKSIALLPHIRSLGADLLYLLPVFQSSDRYKKGSLGSPYAVRAFFSLDMIQHDPLLGEPTEELLNLQFSALIEACHYMGMRVMVDFIFRTCARDNVFIREHPEWFYWIDADRQKDFCAPTVASLKANTETSPENLHILYEKSDLSSYTNFFKNDPKTQDAEKFKQLIEHTPDDQMLAAIEQTFEVTTAPAFSDVINDVQPPWSDVTYLRLDLGRNYFAGRYTSPEIPPFILHDGMKMSVISPGELNQDLCDTLIELIPYYQRKYSIDGARIDMGHALPSSLLLRIVQKIRQNNADFILWSEVFDAKDSQAASDQGFNMMSGRIWQAYAKRNDSDFESFLFDELHEAALPSVAAMELPDTPRSAVLYPDDNVWSHTYTINAFLPNSVLFINSGMELGEQQPTNLGLGHENIFFSLPENDPMRGKLAFFDLYRMHWTNDCHGKLEHIQRIARLRQELLDTTADKSRFRKQSTVKTPLCTDFGYVNDNGEWLIEVKWNRSDETQFIFHTKNSINE